MFNNSFDKRLKQIVVKKINLDLNSLASRSHFATSSLFTKYKKELINNNKT